MTVIPFTRPRSRPTGSRCDLVQPEHWPLGLISRRWRVDCAGARSRRPLAAGMRRQGPRRSRRPRAERREKGRVSIVR